MDINQSEYPYLCQNISNPQMFKLQNVQQFITMLCMKHQVSFSNNKHFVIGCQVCQPIREEEIKTLLFSDWFTDLTTNHKVFVFRKRDLMFRTKHGIPLILRKRNELHLDTIDILE